MDPFELDLTASDCNSSMNDWQLVHPSPKSLPLPSHFTRHQTPRIRSPFQVSDLPSSSSSTTDGPQWTVPTSKPAGGLQRPVLREQEIGSMKYPALKQQSSGLEGLPAPQFSQPVPRSLLDQPSGEGISTDDPSGCQKQVQYGQDSVRPQQPGMHVPQMPMFRKSQRASELTRVRLACTSPLVWKLWLQLAAALQGFSDVLQQLSMSKFQDEHAERFLNQFAATTLVRYISAILQFVRICQDMQVSLDQLSEATFADLLICGSLARRADGTGPKSSITIKAVRWAFTHLGVKVFACAYGSMITSFSKQKIPSDRRESLPLPLFIIAKWERRVLQSQASSKEIIILGGLLLICWSGLRFSDAQRSHLSTWQLDQSSLRGLTWRAKTCNTSTPFGVTLAGLLSRGSLTWIHRFLQTLESLYAGQDSHVIDFTIPAFHQAEVPTQPFEAMSYSEALYYMRFYMQLPWSGNSLATQVNTSSYSVHGLKTTLLSWAAQANLPEEDRRLHGKHKASQTSVQLYSRDDILGSLRLQNALIQRIQQNWRPATPLARGGQLPLAEPQFALEQFKKELQPIDWQFFQFNALSSMQELADCTIPVDTPELDSSGSSSSSGCESSASSSSSSAEAAQPQKKRSIANREDLGPADEILVGLHRKTWHVMTVADVENTELPHWQGKALKSACGRFFPQIKVCPGVDMSLDTNQALCSHVGCRKGFKCVGFHPG